MIARHRLRRSHRRHFRAGALRHFGGAGADRGRRRGLRLGRQRGSARAGCRCAEHRARAVGTLAVGRHGRARAVARRSAHASRSRMRSCSAPAPRAPRSSATSNCSRAPFGPTPRRAGKGAGHRGHRHQRQIDHHGADRPHPERLRLRRRGGRQYRQARARSRAARRPRPSMCSRSRPTRSISRRASCPTWRCSPIFRPITSTATARWRITPRSRRRCCAHVPRDGHVVVGVDDPYSAAIYTRLAAGRGADAVAVSVGKVLGRGVFVFDGKLYDAWDQPARLWLAISTHGRQHLPGAHNWQNAAVAYAAVRRLVRDPRADHRRHPALSRPGAPHGRGRRASARCASSTIPRRPTPMPRRARSPASTTSTGSRAASPRRAASNRLAPYFPRIRARLSDRRSGATRSCSTLSGGAGRHHRLRHSRQGALARRLRQCPALRLPTIRWSCLSPACASFDQFRDFEARGDAFRAAVNTLIAREAQHRRRCA